MRPSVQAFRRPPGKAPLIFGHRGVRGPVPENTLAAFTRAADDGADGIELDVRLARSGEVIVLHDLDPSRVTHGREGRPAATLSFDALRRLDLDGEKIPRLEEVLSLARDRGLLVNIELKHDVAERVPLVRAVKKVLKTSSVSPEQVILSSFHPKLLLLARALLPQIGRAFLCHQGQRRKHPFAVARALSPQGLHPEWTLLLAAPPRALRIGLQGQPRGAPNRPVVSVWTVNEEAAARTLASLPDELVDSLITDRPGALRHLFASDAALGLAG
jgi:glycerophosphoryl diester phosphodiesterase